MQQAGQVVHQMFRTQLFDTQESRVRDLDQAMAEWDSTGLSPHPAPGVCALLLLLFPPLLFPRPERAEELETETLSGNKEAHLCGPKCCRKMLTPDTFLLLPAASGLPQTDALL